MGDDDTFRVGLFSAYPDFGNLGCNALTLAFLDLVIAQRPNATFTFLHALNAPDKRTIEVSGRPIEAPLENCRLHPISSPRRYLPAIYVMSMVYRLCPSKALRARIAKFSPWLTVIHRSTFTATHFYGDSFSDIYGLKRFGRYVGYCGTALVMGRDFVLLPQTYGPFKTFRARWLARWVLKRASVVMARDRAGVENVRALLGKAAIDVDIRYCPDLAFALPVSKPEADKIDPPLADDDRPLVGVNVSGLLFNGGYTRDNMFGLAHDYREMATTLVRDLLARTDARILLVPHVISEDVESDNIACGEILDSLTKAERARVHLLTQCRDASQVKTQIGRCDFFIGSRMHACIAALSQGIPAVGIAYSDKFVGVFESVDVADLVVDARSASAKDIAEHCVAQFESRGDAATRLAISVPKARAQLVAAITQVCAGAKP